METHLKASTLTNPFPSVYYVYEHVHPITNEVFYVGYGSGGRAWTCGHYGTPIRDPEHKAWIDKMIEGGYHPGQFVRIIMYNLTKEEARKAELFHIHSIKPIYNKSIRYKGLKFLPELYDEAIKLREEGLSYEAIGRKLKLSTMTVHRGLSGKSISLETALGER